MKPLPTELSTAQMCELIGISKQHLGRLERDRIVKKLGKNRYATSSVAAVFDHMRKRGAGPARWNEARCKRMEEAALLAEHERRLREGELMLRADFEIPFMAWLMAIRAALLALPNGVGAHLHGRYDEALVLEMVSLTKKLIYELLTRFSKMTDFEYRRMHDDARRHKEGRDVETEGEVETEDA